MNAVEEISALTILVERAVKKVAELKTKVEVATQELSKLREGKECVE